MGMQRRLASGKFGGRESARAREGEFRVRLMQLLEAVRHPQALTIDGVDRSPVDRRGTRAQGLVDAVTKADTLNKRQTLR